MTVLALLVLAFLLGAETDARVIHYQNRRKT